MTRKVAEFATELADREAIRDCLMRLSRAIDRIDVSLGSHLYWPEGTDDHGGLFRGGWSEYFAFAEKLLNGMDATQHFIGNILIEIHGDDANVESYVLAYHGLTSNGSKLNYVGGARYLDKLQKRSDEWRILNRMLVVDWMKTIPDDPRWTSDPIGGHFITGARKPDDASMRHFERLGQTPER